MPRFRQSDFPDCAKTARRTRSQSTGVRCASTFSLNCQNSRNPAIKASNLWAPSTVQLMNVSPSVPSLSENRRESRSVVRDNRANGFLEVVRRGVDKLLQILIGFPQVVSGLPEHGDVVDREENDSFVSLTDLPRVHHHRPDAEAFGLLLYFKIFQQRIVRYNILQQLPQSSEYPTGPRPSRKSAVLRRC